MDRCADLEMQVAQLTTRISLLEREAAHKSGHIKALTSALTVLGHALREQASELRIGAKVLQGLQFKCNSIAAKLDNYAIQIFSVTKHEVGSNDQT